MKAFICRRYGPPEVLELNEVTRPIPGDNDILIKVHATAVTTGDCNARGFSYIPPGLGLVARIMLGFRKPKIPILGSVFSGVVEGIGANVKMFSKGDQVFGVDGDKLGLYAEYKCLAETGTIALKPKNVNHATAAAIPFGALTALYFLRDKGAIKRNHKVLVLGASGTVGSAAVQIAKNFGVQVTGVCSTKNIDFVKSLGADNIIDSTHENLSSQGGQYDLILDTVLGDPTFFKLKKLMAKNGFYLAVAGGIKEILLMLWTIFLNGRKVVFGGGMECERKENLLFLKTLVETGKLKAIIDKRFSFEEMVEAHRYFEKGNRKGGVVVTFG